MYAFQQYIHNKQEEQKLQPNSHVVIQDVGSAIQRGRYHPHEEQLSLNINKILTAMKHETFEKIIQNAKCRKDFSEVYIKSISEPACIHKF